MNVFVLQKVTISVFVTRWILGINLRSVAVKPFKVETEKKTGNTFGE